LRADRFAAQLEPLIAQAMDALRGALDQNHLELADIDAFLVVGSAAQMTPVWDRVLKEFGCKLERTSPDLVAQGAAWYARLLDQEVPASESSAARAEPDLSLPGEPTSPQEPWPATKMDPAIEVAEVTELGEEIPESQGPADASEPAMGGADLATARRLIE